MLESKTMLNSKNVNFGRLTEVSPSALIWQQGVGAETISSQLLQLCFQTFVAPHHQCQQFVASLVKWICQQKKRKEKKKSCLVY